MTIINKKSSELLSICILLGSGLSLINSKFTMLSNIGWVFTIGAIGIIFCLTVDIFRERKLTDIVLCTCYHEKKYHIDKTSWVTDHKKIGCQILNCPCRQFQKSEII